MSKSHDQSFLNEQLALSGQQYVEDSVSLLNFELLKPGGGTLSIDRARDLLNRGDLHGAKNLLAHALNASPFNFDVKALYGAVCIVTGNAAEALPHLVSVAESQPQWAEMRRLCAEAALQSGQLDVAVAYFRRALELKPGWPDAAMRLGETLIKMGEYEEGWRLYDARWQSSANLGPPPDGRVPRYTGAQNLAGRTIVILAEQSLADLFQFIRLARSLQQRGATVIATCPGDLKDLIQSVPGVSLAVPFGERIPPVHYQIPLMNIPAAIRLTTGTVPTEFPYLNVPVPLRQTSRSRFNGLTRPGTLRIGVLWKGYPGETLPYGAALPLEHYAPLWDIEGVTWFSLATGDAVDDLQTVKTPLIDLSEQLDSADAFAAAVSNLDALVSVDTAVLHIAGALHRRAFVPLNTACHFRWPGISEYTPWYPSIRLFRQQVEGDWAPPIAKMARAVGEFVKSKLAAATSR